MPLFLVFLTSFERSFKSLSPAQQQIVNLTLKALEAYYASDCDLLSAQKIAPRFFYKQLSKPFYEAGVEGKLRIVIRRDESRCSAQMAGNHDQVKRFLANH